MRIAILTSSRADYGIYLPLLKALQADSFFDLHIIAFGTHLSHFHGYTVSQIEKDGFTIAHKVETVQAADTEEAISTSMALTQMKFSSIWARESKNYSLVFCLGDRYEMFAAVAAAIPFNIKFAHLHGGETTLGAIDNTFRHCITQMSQLHFVATDAYAQKVAALTDSDSNIYTVGALSLANINQLPVMNKAEILAEFGIDFNKVTVLVTFHPETISVESNRAYVKELIGALDTLKEQIVITMPNTDTMGNVLRKEYEAFGMHKNNVILIENFGTKGYFSAMKHSAYLLGNTSSGILEAASMNKYVINVGNRQKGRARSENVIDVQPNKTEILNAVQIVAGKGEYTGSNIYYKPDVDKKIIEVLKQTAI